MKYLISKITRRVKVVKHIIARNDHEGFKAPRYEEEKSTKETGINPFSGFDFWPPEVFNLWRHKANGYNH
jgi:hypothetical protein